MCGRTAGWLEDYHSHIVHATVVDWHGVEQQQAAAAGVPAGPPPLLAARLAARAAEALCRLCRGQGLGGAYAPAPEWQFAKAEVRCWLAGVRGIEEDLQVKECMGWGLGVVLVRTSLQCASAMYFAGVACRH